MNWPGVDGEAAEVRDDAVKRRGRTGGISPAVEYDSSKGPSLCAELRRQAGAVADDVRDPDHASGASAKYRARAGIQGRRLVSPWMASCRLLSNPENRRRRRTTTWCTSRVRVERGQSGTDIRRSRSGTAEVHIVGSDARGLDVLLPGEAGAASSWGSA